MHLRETFGRLTAGFRGQLPEAVPGHGHLIRLLLLAQQRLQTMQALVYTTLGLRQFPATGVLVRAVPGAVVGVARWARLASRVRRLGKCLTPDEPYSGS